MTADATGTQAASPSELADLVLGILGGTGDQGRGLCAASPWPGTGSSSAPVTRAGRSRRRLTSVAGPLIEGGLNHEAAAEADVVIAAIPWEGHADLLSELAGPLAGKIVIDCVNPIGFDSRGAYSIGVPEGSAAEQAASVFPASTVVGAFHHVSAQLLLDPDVATMDLDVLVLGDDRAGTDLVIALAGEIPGMRGVYGGRLRNCGQVEAFTANLVSINRRYKARAGIHITDV